MPLYGVTLDSTLDTSSALRGVGPMLRGASFTKDLTEPNGVSRVRHMFDHLRYIGSFFINTIPGESPQTISRYLASDVYIYNWEGLCLRMHRLRSSVPFRHVVRRKMYNHRIFP